MNTGPRLQTTIQSSAVADRLLPFTSDPDSCEVRMNSKIFPAVLLRCALVLWRTNKRRARMRIVKELRKPDTERRRRAENRKRDLNQ